MGKRENDIKEAVHKAVECFSMASILEKRIICIDRINKILAFMGILFPSGIGIAAFKGDELEKLLAVSPSIAAAIIIALFILGLVQTVISACSLACKWNDSLPIYINSKIENYKNAEKYYDIWNKYDENETEFARQLEEVNTRNRTQQEQDYKINLTEKEKRYGMRHALQQYKIICERCRKVPDINNPSNCSVCGK